MPPLAEQDAIELFCARGTTRSERGHRRAVRSPGQPAAGRRAGGCPYEAPSRPSRSWSGSPRGSTCSRGGRDADPRQQTLRATIEWSYELLEDDEKQLFARLSVFTGGCTLEAAEAVADADIDSLQSLVEKSLLRFTDGRYWMLETIREYSRKGLRNRQRSTAVAVAMRTSCCVYRARSAKLPGHDPSFSTRLLRSKTTFVRRSRGWVTRIDPPTSSTSSARRGRSGLIGGCGPRQCVGSRRRCATRPSRARLVPRCS